MTVPHEGDKEERPLRQEDFAIIGTSLYGVVYVEDEIQVIVRLRCLRIF